MDLFFSFDSIDPFCDVRKLSIIQSNERKRYRIDLRYLSETHTKLLQFRKM